MTWEPLLWQPYLLIKCPGNIWVVLEAVIWLVLTLTWWIFNSVVRHQWTNYGFRGFPDRKSFACECSWGRHPKPTCSFITSHSRGGHHLLNPWVIILQGYIGGSSGCHSFISFELIHTDWISKQFVLLIHFLFSAVIECEPLADALFFELWCISGVSASQITVQPFSRRPFPSQGGLEHAFHPLLVVKVI